MEKQIQIDVTGKVKEAIGIVCNLYTGHRCVQIVMSSQDYNSLMRDGFFIRNGKEADSANIMNTTEVYELKKS